ncbi:Cys-Cys-COOH (seleno)protein SaoC [Lagierella sp.]|uniref:Cys-Cys-COOH (seleno)protein SaoC n=1 Tax=Lagierella sp. TaxID=2849657 RepID=UPI00262FCA98|nr:Cys-Cys-COOH (seleno)protein SaoC [Lagierella sp.]
MKKESINGSKITKVLLIIIVLLVGYLGYRNNLKFKEEDFGVERDNYLLLAFQNKFPDKEVIKCQLGDLTGNDIDDLVVIFKENEDAKHLLVVKDEDGKINFTEDVSAPYENQRIEIKDINNEPPNEFIVSGSKRGQYGYGIFRIEDNHLHNLFSEGMTAC